MNDQKELFPSPKGLSRDQLRRLNQLAEAVQTSSLDDLHRRAREHVQRARLANVKNPFVNVRFAEAIGGVIDAVVREWKSFTPDAQYWFRGAIQYFFDADDGEHDFNSIIGFDDDSQVLNACLQLAGRGNWCLRPEDYDHV
jgi:hypothetical protein